MRPRFEIYIAMATLKLAPEALAADTDADSRARALVYMPVIGCALGVGLAFIDWALGAAVPPTIRSALMVVLAAGAHRGILQSGVARTFATLLRGESQAWGWVLALVLLVGEAASLSVVAHSDARARAAILSMTLSRWAMVPVGYGLKATGRSGLGVPYDGGIRFREFAISSTVALGLAMGLYQAIGLASIVAVALIILGLRLLLSRRLGGVDGYALAASAFVCEFAIIAILAALHV